MVEIELTKAALVPPASTLRRSGTVVNVDADVADGLVARGVAKRVTAPDDDSPVVVVSADRFDEVGTEVSDTPDDAEGVDPAPDDAEPALQKPSRDRPKKTAPLAVWQEYAHEGGLKTTGLKKEEIIAAVEARNL